MPLRMYMQDDDRYCLQHHVYDADVAANGPVISLEPEKPWMVLFSPYVKNRPVFYCPSDPVARTKTQAPERIALLLTGMAVRAGAIHSSTVPRRYDDWLTDH
jgi:hypothetical protein